MVDCRVMSIEAHEHANKVVLCVANYRYVYLWITSALVVLQQDTVTQYVVVVIVLALATVFTLHNS